MRPMMKVALPALWLGLQLCGSSAFAEPTLYPTNVGDLATIKNTTNSNILGDEVDPKTVWVMPPNTASAIASGFDARSSSHLGFCAEMGDLQSYSRELSADVMDLMRQKKAKSEQLIKLSEKASELEVEAQNWAYDKGFSALGDLDARLKVIDDRLTELYRLEANCSHSCEVVTKEMEILVGEKEQLQKDRRDLAKSTSNDMREYTKKLNAAKAARTRYLQARNVYGDLADDMRAIQEKFKQSYLSYGQLYGGTANFKYVSSWDKNVAALRSANPGVNFQKMKTQNAVMMTAISGVKDLDPYGAIKDIRVPGGSKEGLGTYRYSAYPESLSSQVDLTLVGACPMAFPQYFEKDPAGEGEMAYGLIITYDYQTVFKMKATATYNMFKLYQKIISSGSSGGLFSSRSWTNTEERDLFSDSFSVVWNDKENTVPAQEKLERESEMRKAILLRLATLAVPETPSKVELLAAAAPGPHGSVVLADALARNCGINYYCQGAGIVLRVLDAIFGSSSTSSSYTRITKNDLTENYEVDQKITKSWITSYL